MWDEITYPFPNFNGGTVEVWEGISNFVPHLTRHVVTYPCWDKSLNMFIKKGPRKFVNPEASLWAGSVSSWPQCVMWSKYRLTHFRYGWWMVCRLLNSPSLVAVALTALVYALRTYLFQENQFNRNRDEKWCRLFCWWNQNYDLFGYHLITCQLHVPYLPIGQNGRHFAEYSFKYIFMKEKFCISIKILLKFFHRIPIDSNPALV